MIHFQDEIFVKRLVYRIIENAILSSNEKYALQLLRKSSFKSMLKKNNFANTLQHGDIDKNSTNYYYPAYFQHG